MEQQIEQAKFELENQESKKDQKAKLRSEEIQEFS
jgi:hypothetical protein